MFNSRLVKEWLAGNDMRRKELAQYFNINPSTLWRYLTNRTQPSRAIVLALAHKMGVSPNELMSDEKQAS